MLLLRAINEGLRLTPLLSHPISELVFASTCPEVNPLLILAIQMR